MGGLTGGTTCHAADPAEYEQQWQESDQDLQTARSAAVYHARLGLVDAPLFDALPEELRYARVRSTSWLAIDQQDYSNAHRLLVRSSGMAGQSAEDWRGRLIAAFEMGDLDDAALALTRIAQ